MAKWPCAGIVMTTEACGEMHMELTAVFEKVPEGYIAFVEELPGANTQGATLEEARAHLKEAVELVFEATRDLAEESIRGRTVVKERLITAA
jgi:predicted RNase H-like HicB family nuclease